MSRAESDRPAGDFTLIELLRELGYSHLNKWDNWPLGSRLRNRYIAVVGEPPVKAQREQTHPDHGGTHHFAIYPVEFRPHAEKLLHEWFANRERQLNLFPADILELSP